MDGLLLDRAEFLVLLDAVRAGSVVGLERDDLIPPTREEHRALVEQGHARLAQRGLLQIQADDVRSLHVELATIATIIADPELASITVRDIPALGKQLFLHYANANGIVEQTLPEEGMHRLATLESLEQLITRLLALLPVSESMAVGTRVSMPLDSFLQVKQLAENHQSVEAERILADQGCTSDVAQLLLEAIMRPQMSGTLALLRCEQREIVDARNPAFLQGPSTAWLIAEAVPGEASLVIESIDQQLFRQRISDLIMQLIASNPAPA